MSRCIDGQVPELVDNAIPMMPDRSADLNTTETRRSHGSSREDHSTQHPTDDRRRPGRRDFDNPALIALLRENRHLEPPTSSDEEREDAAALKGITAAAVIAALALGAVVLLTLLG
jgi:hypothetical protein